MSTVVHPLTQYRSMKRELTKKDEKCGVLYVRLCMVLDRFGPEIMTPAELQVIRFLMGRTFSFGKRAEVIPFRHMEEGVYGPKGCTTTGVGLSESTIRKALARLHERELITVHAFKQGNIESDCRVYAVNVTPFMAYKIFESDDEIGYEMGDDPLVNFTTPPSSKLLVISKEGVSKQTSSKEDVSASPTRPVIRRTKDMAEKIAINCKPSPEDIIKGVKEGYQNRNNARVSANKNLPKRPWPTTAIQALMDEARKRAEAEGYKTPRVVVVQKCISTLHSRLVAHEVADPLQFFTWALQNWEKVASSNRRAKARQIKQTQAAKSEMSMAPNFRDLAFLAPYFITIYNDREQTEINEKRVQVEQQQKVAKVREASASYLDAKREQTRKEDLAREAERGRSTPIRRTRRAVPVDDDFTSTDEAPRFRSRITE